MTDNALDISEEGATEGEGPHSNYGKTEKENGRLFCCSRNEPRRGSKECHGTCGGENSENETGKKLPQSGLRKEQDVFHCRIVRG